MDINTTSTPRDKFLGKVLNGSFTVSAVAVGIFVTFKVVFPSKDDGLSIIPIVDTILLSMLAFGFIGIMSIIGFQAWTKDTDEFYEWLASQKVLRSSHPNAVHVTFPKWIYIWMARITPIMALMVLCISGLIFLASSLDSVP